MKRFIGKHIALFLSLALIMGTVLPVISGNFASAAETTEAQDIVAIKTAWGKMKTPVSTIYSPVAYRYGASSDQAGTGIYAKGEHATAGIFSTLTESDSNFPRLGTAIATYSITDGLGKTEANTNTKYTVFFAADAGLSAGVYKLTSSIDELFFCFRADSITASGDLGFNIFSGTTNTVYNSNYTVHLDKDNYNSDGWIEVSLAEIWESNRLGLTDSFKDFFTANTLTRFEAIPINGLDATVTFGSVISSTKAILPADATTTNWNIEDWIYEADNFDSTGYLNSAEFETIVNELKTKYSERISIAALKTAWTEMCSRTSILYPSTEKVGGTTLSLSPDDRKVTANGNLPNGATADMLGTNYAHYHSSYDAGLSDSRVTVNTTERFMMYGSPSDQTRARVPLADIDEFYFNIYIEDVTVGGELKIGIVDYDYETIVADTITIDGSMKGKWITFKDTDLYAGGVTGMAAYFAAKGKSQDIAFFNMGLAKGLICKAYLGSVVKLNHLNLPENSNDWTATQWIMAAEQLDTTGNTNVENFEAKLSALKQQSGSEYAIEKLKSAWTSLSATAKTIYSPVSYRATGASAGDIKGTMETNPAAETLGLGSYTYDIEAAPGQIAPGDSANRVIFVTEASNNLTPQNKFDVEDMALRFRVNSIINPGKIGFKIIGVGACTFKSSYTIDVNADTLGTWQTVMASDIFKNTTSQNLSDDPKAADALVDFNNNMSFSDFFKKYTLARIEIVPLCDSSNVPTKTNISITSLMSTTALTVPTELNDVSISELLAAAEHLDTSTCINTEQFNATIDEIQDYIDTEEYAFANSKYEVFNGITQRTVFAPSEIMTKDSSVAFDIEPFAPADIVAPLDYQNDFGGYVANYSKTNDGTTENGIICAATDNSLINIDKVDDIYFYYKSDKAFNLRLVDSYDQYAIDVVINKTVASAADWTKCSLNSLIGTNWKNELKNNSEYSSYQTKKATKPDFNLKSIQLVFTGAANCQVGAIIGEKAISAVDYIDFVTSADYATVIANGYAIDSKNFGNALNFRNRIAAIINANGSTNDATLGCTTADYVNGYSIKDLVRLNNYIDDTSIVIDQKAADFDKSGTIDALDINALRAAF